MHTSLCNMRLGRTYNRWMDKTGQLPLSPLVLSANKPAAAKHVMDKDAVASADSGSDAGAARFNKWLTGEHFVYSGTALV